MLNRDFTTTGPNQKWVADTTSIPTTAGWLHLAVVMDLFSRRIVGYALSVRNDAHLAFKASRDAIALRQPLKGLILHTDQGGPYTSALHTDLLKEHGIEHSLSRRGDCYDNAAMESWNGRFKVEALYGRPLPTRSEAEVVVMEHVDRYYNHIRLHSALGYLSPANFEQHAIMTLAA